MAVRGPRWTRLERDERRAQILACARRLFSERHYEAVPMAEIAREAGVARGLLHHYFGTKRALFLEVVRSMFELPPGLFTAEPAAVRPSREQLAAAVERWLETLHRNHGTWLASVGVQGFGRDPDLEAILDDAREETADRVIVLVGAGDPAEASPELRALVRSYAGLAEAASLEWLERRRLTREQVRVLLLESLLALVERVLPLVEDAGGGSGSPVGAGRTRRATEGGRKAA
jgi:AcrR family transcriptional regulator